MLSKIVYKWMFAKIDKMLKLYTKMQKSYIEKIGVMTSTIILFFWLIIDMNKY